MQASHDDYGFNIERRGGREEIANPFGHGGNLAGRHGGVRVVDYETVAAGLPVPA
jgi:hypothetical protein